MFGDGVLERIWQGRTLRGSEDKEYSRVPWHCYSTGLPCG